MQSTLEEKIRKFDQWVEAEKLYLKPPCDLLNAIAQEFPLDTMGPTFKGNHALYLKGNELHVLLWAEGKAYDLYYSVIPQAFLNLPLK